MAFFTEPTPSQLHKYLHTTDASSHAPDLCILSSKNAYTSPNRTYTSFGASSTRPNESPARIRGTSVAPDRSPVSICGTITCANQSPVSIGATPAAIFPSIDSIYYAVAAIGGRPIGVRRPSNRPSPRCVPPRAPRHSDRHLARPPDTPAGLARPSPSSPPPPVVAACRVALTNRRLAESADSTAAGADTPDCTTCLMFLPVSHGRLADCRSRARAVCVRRVWSGDPPM